ncbi:MAG: hypothetical protein M1826_006554 [Phylliscum demangeonii]|nr:MAG: hypothetical protein M1826_006554 [Phylliscum demangeonii]
MSDSMVASALTKCKGALRTKDRAIVTPSSSPVLAERDERPRRKRKTIAFAAPPSSPPVLHRPEPAARASAPPPSSSSLSSLPSPSNWIRPASGPPNKRKATPNATSRPRPAPSPASDDRRRLVEVLLDGIPGGALSHRGPRQRSSVRDVLAGGSFALSAGTASDPRYWWVQVRLTGIPGGDVVLAGLVRGLLASRREGEVLHVGGREPG